MSWEQRRRDWKEFCPYAGWQEGEVLTCKGGKKDFQEDEEEDTYLTMNGQEVFRFAVKKVPECIQQVMEKAGRKKEEIRSYICIGKQPYHPCSGKAAGRAGRKISP